MIIITLVVAILDFFYAVFRYFNLIAVLRYSLNLRDLFLSVLVDDCQYKNVSFTLSRLVSLVSGRFGSKMKHSYFATYFNLQFDYFKNQLKSVLLFPRSRRSFYLRFFFTRYPVIQACYDLAVFSDFFFFVIAIFAIFYGGNEVFRNPLVPHHEVIDKLNFRDLVSRFLCLNLYNLDTRQITLVLVTWQINSEYIS